MPPKAPKKSCSNQKRIAELEQQIADQNKTIGNLEKKVEEANEVTLMMKNLIPKPPGQAGRKNGYSLFKELKLPQARYARILRITRIIASHGLDPTKSFREQEKSRMKAVVAKVVTNVPVMKHYHGYWPVLAIIKQYLSNIKKRLAQDLKAEQGDPGLPGSIESQNIAPKVDEEYGDDSSHIRNAKVPKKAASKTGKTKKHHSNGSGKASRIEELEDVESEDESEDEDSEFEFEEGDQDEVDSKVDADEDETDPEDDEAEMEMYKYYGSALDRNSKQDNDDERHKSNDGGIPPASVEKSKPTNRSELVNKSVGKEKSAQIPAKVPLSKPEATKTIAFTTEGGNGKIPSESKKRAAAAMQTPDTQRTTKHARTNQTTTAGEVRCPEDGCVDVLQGAPSERLELMFQKLSSVRSGKETGTPLVLSLFICQAIKEEMRFPMLKALGEQSGWPRAINFEGIPAQIMALKDEINGFLKNEIILGTSFAWCTFVKDVTSGGAGLAEFASSSEATRFSVAGMGDNRHAGYYGPMGESVILSTLNRLFPDTSSATNELASTLSSIYENEMADTEGGDLAGQFWEGTTDSLSPMTLRDFLTYLVVPETTVLLIAKELKVTSAQANRIRLESKEYGKAFHSKTDDGRIDDITNTNVRALRAEQPAQQCPPRMKRKRADFSTPLTFESMRNHGSSPNEENQPPGMMTPPAAKLPRKIASQLVVPRNATPGPGPKTAAKRAMKPHAAATKPTRRSTRKPQKKSPNLPQNLPQN